MFAAERSGAEAEERRHFRVFRRIPSLNFQDGSEAKRITGFIYLFIFLAVVVGWGVGGVVGNIGNTVMGKKELDQIKKSQDVERECEKGSAPSHR